MNKFVIFIILPFVSSVLSAPSPLRSLPALKHEHIQDQFGQYALRYVTAEGTIVSEKGQLIATPDGTGHVMIMEGEVTYIGDDGNTYITKYTAGLDGVKVEGDHLPIAPTTPPVDSSSVPVETTVAPVDVSTSASVETTVVSVDEPVPAPVGTLPDAPAIPPMTPTVAA